MSQSKIISQYESARPMKVKVVKWCRNAVGRMRGHVWQQQHGALGHVLGDQGSLLSSTEHVEISFTISGNLGRGRDAIARTNKSYLVQVFLEAWGTRGTKVFFRGTERGRARECDRPRNAREPVGV